MGFTYGGTPDGVVVMVFGITNKLGVAGVPTAGILLSGAISGATIQRIGYLLENPHIIEEEGVRLNIDEEKLAVTFALFAVVYGTSQIWAASRLIRDKAFIEASQIALESAEDIAGQQFAIRQGAQEVLLLEMQIASNAEAVSAVRNIGIDFDEGIEAATRLRGREVILGEMVEATEAMQYSTDVMIEVQGIMEGYNPMVDAANAGDFAAYQRELQIVNETQIFDDVLRAAHHADLQMLNMAENIDEARQALNILADGSGADLIRQMHLEQMDNIMYAYNAEALRIGHPIAVVEGMTNRQVWLDMLRNNRVIGEEIRTEFGVLQTRMAFQSEQIRNMTRPIIAQQQPLRFSVFDELFVGEWEGTNSIREFLEGAIDADAHLVEMEREFAVYQAQADEVLRVKEAALAHETSQAIEAKALAKSVNKKAISRMVVTKVVGTLLVLDLLVWIPSLMADLSMNYTSDMTEAEQAAAFDAIGQNLIGQDLGFLVEPMGGWSPIGEWIIGPALEWIMEVIPEAWLDAVWEGLKDAAAFVGLDDLILAAVESYIESIDIEISWYLISNVLTVGTIEGTALWILSNPDYIMGAVVIAVAAKVLFQEVLAPLVSSFFSPTIS